jgi:PKD repeat protein
MAGVTTYTMTSQGASDPDGDSLSYEWAFGDGATGSGQSATHVYDSAGSFNVTLTVKDKEHSATAPSASVTVARSMAGSWSGATNSTLFNSSMAVNLTQSGTSIGGTLTFSGGLSGTVNLASGGTVSERNYPTNVHFQTANFTIGGYCGYFYVRFAGTTDAGGSSMTGTVVNTQVCSSTIAFQSTTTFRR